MSHDQVIEGPGACRGDSAGSRQRSPFAAGRPICRRLVAAPVRYRFGMWGDRRRLFIEWALDRLDEWDLGQLIEDAEALATEYDRRERHHVASAFSTLASFAYDELEDRENSERYSTGSTWVTAAVDFDPTSGAEHNKDDLGTVMARAMEVAERTDINDDLAHVWFQVIRDLARERDRLRAEGVLL